MVDKSASALKALEVLQQALRHSVQRSALRLQQAAEGLSQSRSATELIGIQSNLVMGGLHDWTQYVQELSLAPLRMRDHLQEAGALSTRDAIRLPSPGGGMPTPQGLNEVLAAVEASTTMALANMQSWADMVGSATGHPGR